MITFACPKCSTDYDIGDYIDHIGDMRGNRFEFECKGCCTFECEVEWDPMIYPIASSVVPTQTRESDT